jgi:hypothetical protein
MKILTKLFATTTAIGLVTLSGSISAYGLSQLVPNAKTPIVVMAVLFEAAKLLSFGMVHRPLPKLLKVGLVATGVTLMALNITGVASFLSTAYTQAQVAARAAAHTAEAAAHAGASLLERQLGQSEQAVAQARTALVRAKDDRGRVKAAQAILNSATAERDALVKQLGAAQVSTANVEGAAIQAGGEFATIAFLAQAFGTEPDRMARIVITIIAALPDVLAVILIISLGYVAPKASRSRPATTKKITRRRRRPARPNLQVIPNAAEA